MAKHEELNLYSGYQFKHGGPCISHLMFADDLFFFGKNSEANINQLKKILDDYAAVSGQIINYSKSSIHFNSGCSGYHKGKTIHTFGVREMEVSEKYLGSYPLKSDYNIDTHAPLVSKFNNKLAGYRSFYVNSTGRTVLSKNVLSAIPIYSMGICKLPKKVLKQISQIQRSFWWGHDSHTRKCHFINWEKMARAKEDGGLGLRNMEQVNNSLIAKLVWRFLTSPEDTWVKMYSAKYLHSVSFWDCEDKPGDSKPWKDLLSMKEVFINNCCWFIGSGNSIKVWEDPWISEIPGFRPTRLSQNTMGVKFVSDLFIQGQKTWDIQLLLQLFPTAQAEAIANIYIPQDATIEDKLIWLKTKTGKFSAKSCYKLLADNVATSSFISAFPWKKFWKTMKIMPKIHTFIWKALHNGLAVFENIARFNSQVQNVCVFCNSEIETVFHLLFSCQFSKAVIQASPLHINVSAGTTIMEIIQQWLQQPDQGIMLNLGACILWNIWKSRNAKVFNNEQQSVSACLQNALQDFKAFDLHHALNFCSPVQVHSQVTPQWQTPPRLHFKINVDAAYVDGRGAAAAVASDSEGNHLGSAAFCFSSFSSMVAEAKAYGLGVQLAARIQGSRIIVEGDAEDIPKAIIGNTNDIPWSIRSTVLSIRDRVKNFSDISFTAVPRDANSIAHDLVQFAISNSQNRWWSFDDPPHCIMQRLNLFED